MYSSYTDHTNKHSNFIPHNCEAKLDNDAWIIELGTPSENKLEENSSCLNSIKAVNFISELKTYDSALAVISSSCKLLGLKDEYELVKEMRDLVKYIISIKTVRNGEIDYNLAALVSNPRDRKKAVSSFYTTTSLVTNTVNYVLDIVPESIQENIPDIAFDALNIFNTVVSPLKLAYKLSSLDVALRERFNCKGNSEERKLKNMILLKSGIDAGKELLKTGVLVTGASSSAIPIGLAAAGAISGGIGLYVGYHACGKKKESRSSEEESPV
jgi:hypothetical protein